MWRYHNYTNIDKSLCNDIVVNNKIPHCIKQHIATTAQRIAKDITAYDARYKWSIQPIYDTNKILRQHMQ